MDFTELTEQIDDAVTYHAVEKDEAIGTLKEQVQAIKNWFSKFNELTEDSRRFGLTVTPTMKTFNYDYDSSGVTTKVADLTFLDSRCSSLPQKSCPIYFIRKVNKHGTSYWFDLMGREYDKDSEFFNIVDSFVEDEEKQNYPRLLCNEIGDGYRYSDLNFFWNLINIATPEQIAEMYTQSTLNIVQDFINRIKEKNINLANVIEDAKEKLRQYNDKNKTVVTENSDGSVEIKLNGKTYIGTVKEQ